MSKFNLKHARLLVSTLLLIGASGSVVLASGKPEPQPQPAARPAAAETPRPPANEAPSAPRPNNFADIVRRVAPTVVGVDVQVRIGGRLALAGGSGFIIDPSGYIVTNNHVVAGATRITIRMYDGTKYKAETVNTDPRTDLALLKVEAKKPLPSATFGDDRRLQVGDWVLAVGSPHGLHGTVTAGILSARSRERAEGSLPFTTYLQIDAAVNHGNSGGPSFNMAGQVIGVNTLASYYRVARSVGLGERNESIGFAVPSTTVQEVIRALKKGPVERGFLGVFLEPIDADTAKALGLSSTAGALVSDVVDDGPAAKAGIAPGDVIQKVNGRKVADENDGLRKIAAVGPGKVAKLTIWRTNKELQIDVPIVGRDGFTEASLETKKDSVGFASIGIEVVAASEPSIEGEDATVLIITEVEPGSDAEQRGLRRGDAIVRVAGERVTSLSGFNLALEKAKDLNRPLILLQVETQQGVKAFVPVAIQQ